MAKAKAGVKYPHVTRKEGVQGGRPVIIGTRIPVSTLIIWYKQGEEIDEILEAYPQLTPAQLHDALSYYYDHQEEMEEEIALIQDEAHWQKKYPPGKGTPKEKNRSGEDEIDPDLSG